MASSRPAHRYHRLIPALALVVAACSGAAATPAATPAASPPAAGSSAATSIAPGNGAGGASAYGTPASAAAASAAPASPAPAASAVTTPATPTPTPVPATRPPATPAPATHPPATRPPATPTPAPKAATVTIVDFGFQPATLTVSAGTRVTWKNTGQVDHTVTANNGAFDSGSIAPGASFSFTFRTAGTYAYHCSIHPFMAGTVIVKG